MKNIHKKLLFHEFMGGIAIHGVILAAGEGIRIGELTQKVPKALLPCLGRTLIEHLVDTLLQVGIDEVSVGIGWKGNEVRTLIESIYPRDQVRCIDVPSYQVGPLQTLVTTTSGLDDTLLICPVDFFVDPAVVLQVSASLKERSPFDLLVATDASSQRGTPITIDDNLSILKIGEGTTRSAMMLVASTKFLGYCRNALQTGATRIVQVIENLIEEKQKVVATTIRGFWADIDTLADLLATNTTLLKEHISSSDILFIPDGDHVEIGEALSLASDIHIGAGVKFKGPVLVSRDTRIGENCTIGPNVCVQGQSNILEGCTLADSIVFGASSISPGTSVSRMIVHNSRFYMV
ncbi:MAG: NTP transferase domain-containing protein [Candidatus Thorarchaeota archaeon]